MCDDSIYHGRAPEVENVQESLSPVQGKRRKRGWALWLVGDRNRGEIRLAVCARETVDVVACIEKMAATPIPPEYRGNFFYFICASSPIHGFKESQGDGWLCRVRLVIFTSSLFSSERRDQSFLIRFFGLVAITEDGSAGRAADLANCS